MKYYTQEQIDIPYIAETDVLVCGGGPAGIGAALTAAKEGASVLIVEMGGCLGGIATELRCNRKTLPIYCHLPPIYCHIQFSGKNCSKRLKLS